MKHNLDSLEWLDRVRQNQTRVELKKQAGTIPGSHDTNTQVHARVDELTVAA
jgi:hypothetical protein